MAIQFQDQSIFSNRKGLELFADFYTLSTFYNKDNFFDCEMAQRLLPYVRKDVLDSAATAIFSEIRYYQQVIHKQDGHNQVFRRFGVDKLIIPLIGCRRHQRLFYAKRHKAVVKLIAAARVVFNRPDAFYSAYGGPKWAEICKRWLDLNNYRDFNNPEMFVKIDKLIDAAHNTGRCLDKVYPTINQWLTQKTTITNPYWVVNQSSLRKYAKHRMKQQYRFTEEKFDWKSVKKYEWQEKIEKSIDDLKKKVTLPHNSGLGKLKNAVHVAPKHLKVIKQFSTLVDVKNYIVSVKEIYCNIHADINTKFIDSKTIYEVIIKSVRTLKAINFTYIPECAYKYSGFVDKEDNGTVFIIGDYLTASNFAKKIQSEVKEVKEFKIYPSESLTGYWWVKFYGKA